MAYCANGHASPDGTAYCPTCGLPLAPPTAGPATWSPPAGPPTTEPTPYGPPTPSGQPTTPPAVPFGDLRQPTPPPKRSRRGLFIGLGVVAAIALLAGGALVVTKVAASLLGGDDDEQLLIVSDGGDEDGYGDLTLVALGDDPDTDGTVFARDAYLETIWDLRDDLAQRAEPLPGLIEVDGRHLVAWSDDETTTVALVSLDEDPEVLFDEEGYASIGLDAEREHLLVSLDDDDGATCWAAKVGDELQQIAEADICDLSPAGTALSYDDVDDPETDPFQVQVTDVDGEQLSYFTVPGYPTSSATGAYVYGASSLEFSMTEAATGTEAARMNGDDIVVFDAAAAADRVLVGSVEDDEAVVWSFGPDGDGRELARAPRATAAVTPDGETAVVATADEDGNLTLAEMPADGSGEATVLLDGEDDLGFAITDTSPPSLVAWNADGDLWAAEAGTGELDEIGSLDEGAVPSEVLFDPGARAGYLVSYDESESGDGESVLWRIDGDRLDAVLDTSGDVSMISGDAEGILVNAWDDEDDRLVWVEDTSQEKLDDATRISWPIPLDGDVLYTTSDDDDEAEVVEGDTRRSPIDGSSPAETILPGWWLEGASWAEPAPASDYLGGDDLVWLGSAGAAECDGAEVWEDDVSGEVDIDGVTGCLVIPDGGADVTIEVDAELDTVLEIYDADGNSVDYSDDGDDESWNPYISTYLDGGTYTATLAPYEDDDSGSFDLWVTIDS